MQIEKLETRLRNIIVISGMLFVYMLIASYFFPPGFLSIFFAFLWKWILALILCAVFLFFLLFFRQKKRVRLFKKIDNFESKDLIFFLIPMTPIVQYIIFNNDSLSFVDIVIVISFFSILVIIFAYLIPWGLSIFAPRRILTYGAIFLLFLFFYMPIFTGTIDNLKASIVPILIFIIISALFLAEIDMPKQIVPTIIVAYFLMNTVTSILSANNNIFSFPQTFENSSIVSALENKKNVKKNDIILIVYESYANYETMFLYGFDNKAQIAFLEENGFEVYHGIYSLGAPTIPSMSKVFNIEPKGSDRKIITGQGFAHNILRKKGYQIYGVFQNDFFFRGLYPNEIEMDSYFPDFYGGAKVLIEGILTGYLGDPFSFRGVGLEAYLKKKHNVLKEKVATPKLLYTHSIKPGHSPDEGINFNEQEKILSIYYGRLQKANDEMRTEVKLLIKNNPEAIVIIAGDHGPFMTKQGYGLSRSLTDYSSDDIDRLDIQDRFGAFLAIRWPEDGYAEKYDIKILQDIFPAVFSYLFNDDTLFDTIRIKKRITVTNDLTLGVYVDDGMIIGGKDDGKPLFEGIQ